MHEALIASSEGATARGMLNSFTEIGLEQIVGSTTAWVNVSREFVLSGLAQAVPPGLVGLEILEDELLDDDMIAALRELKRLGYRLALDHFHLRRDTRLQAAAVHQLGVLRVAREVSSVGQALALLGLDNVRRWATLSVLANVDDKPTELTVTALIRARVL